MKKLAYFLNLIIFLPSFLSGQKVTHPYQTSVNISSKIAKNMETGGFIYANQYVFSKPILNFFVDFEDSNKIFIINEESISDGQIAYFDLPSGKSVYGIEYNLTSDRLMVKDNNIFFLDQNGLSKYNKFTGKVLFTLPLKNYFANRDADFIVGYSKNKKRSKDELMIYSFNSGNFKNSVIIEEDAGIERYQVLGDSNLIVLASGIHLINLKNGSQWSFNENTTTKVELFLNPLSTKGLALGTMIGYYSEPEAINKTFGISSNLYIENNKMYKSSLSKISCLDLDGNVIWTKPLNEGISSTSVVFKNKEYLYHLNLGYAFSTGFALNRGDPFIAVRDVENGKMINNVMLGTKRTRLTDFQVDSTNLYTLTDKKLISFKLGNLIENASIDNKSSQFGELQYFERKSFYYLEGDKYQIYNTDTSLLYLKTKEGRMVCFNKNLKYIKQFDHKNLWLKFATFGEYFFIINNEEVKVIKDGKVVTSFDKVTNLKFSDQQLFIYNKFINRFLKIDLLTALNVTNLNTKIERH